MASTLKPTPNGGTTDFSDDPPSNNLCGDLTGAESREWNTSLTGKFAGYRFYLNNHVRGENRAAARVVSDLPTPPVAA